MSINHLLESGRRPVLVAVLAVLAVLVAPGVATAKGGGGEGPGNPSPQGAAARVAAEDNREALAYWTPERMKAARPAAPGLNGRAGPPAPPADRGRPETVPPAAATVQGQSTATATTTAASEGYGQGSNTANPNRQIGRLFFQAYDPASRTWYPSSCSGTVVNSENKSVVWTAGHCVFQTYSNVWNRNYVFCPGYRDNTCPLGRWTPYSQSTTSQWMNSRCQVDLKCTSPEFQYDFGALRMNALNGYRIVNRVGGHGIGFNGAVQQTGYLFGYPLNKHNGQYLYFCHGTNSFDGYNLRLPCTAGGGASGGPWLSQISSAWLGSVRSVNSHGNGSYLGGPYQGNVAANLFAAVRY